MGVEQIESNNQKEIVSFCYYKEYSAEAHVGIDLHVSEDNMEPSVCFVSLICSNLCSEHPSFYDTKLSLFLDFHGRVISILLLNILYPQV